MSHVVFSSISADVQNLKRSSADDIKPQVDLVRTSICNLARHFLLEEPGFGRRFIDELNGQEKESASTGNSDQDLKNIEKITKWFSKTVEDLQVLRYTHEFRDSLKENAE